jgi:hypothetical protein
VNPKSGVFRVGGESSHVGVVQSSLAVAKIGIPRWQGLPAAFDEGFPLRLGRIAIWISSHLRTRLVIRRSDESRLAIS